METITFYLKQHTPLIDFQHYQEGSTLRASAVKPQLDRFLVNLMGGRKTASDNGWLAQTDNPDSTALNYRMTIVPTNERDSRMTSKLLNSYPNFFGNMRVNPNDNENYKRFTFYPNPLKVTLTFPSVEGPSLAEFLRKEHREALAQFFFRTNFGTRASKGFGSYYINKGDFFYVSPSELNTDDYSFVIDSENELYEEIEGNRYNVLFRVIELFYKALRSGINEYNNEINIYYFKSLAHVYCSEMLHLRWDKRTIKDNFNRIAQNSTPNVTDCDIKDAFGFSTEEKWSFGNNRFPLNRTIKKKAVSLDNRIPEREAPTRMQSPLLFKPILIKDKTFRVYLIFKEDEVNLTNFISKNKIQVDSFAREFTEGRTRNILRSRVYLNLPDRFCLKDFFSYILNEYDIDVNAHLRTYSNRQPNNFANHYYTNILTDIFEQLKEQ